ncbi:hypothetical protein V3C33_15940 [Micrococcaceae bacterium Sec5.7]
MPDALDIAGPILELLTWLCLPLGLILLVTVGSIRRFGYPWVAADGVVYADETGTGFRWFDHKYRVHHAPMSRHDIKDMAAGDAVVIYYLLNRPSQWQTAVPEIPWKTAGILGWLLAGIGAAALVSGYVLPLF